MVRSARRVIRGAGVGIWIPHGVKKSIERPSILDQLQNQALLNGPEGFFVMEMCDSVVKAPKDWHSGR